MANVFKSKIGFIFFIPLISGMLLIALLMINDHKAWIGILILFLVALFLIINFNSIRYIIDGERLIVKGFPFYNRSIPISKITKIKETNNPLSSPAASMDRLEIRYNKYDSVILSPRDKKGFIDELLKINAKIEVINRKAKPLR